MERQGQGRTHTHGHGGEAGALRGCGAGADQARHGAEAPGIQPEGARRGWGTSSFHATSKTGFKLR
eukprot:3241620-Pleurochrysis_carterae.AAC.3